MVDEKVLAQAKQVYQTLCDALDGMGLKYAKSERENEFIANFGLKGKDVPMQFILVVDAKRQIVSLLSPMPFKMCEDKRMDGAIATCVATYALADGCFDYDLTDGEIVFRMVTSFRGSLIGKELLQYMVVVASDTIDRYNDRFLMLDKGMLSLADFIAKENS